MRHHARSSLVQIMAGDQLGAMPLSEPMLYYCVQSLKMPKRGFTRSSVKFKGHIENGQFGSDWSVSG